VKAFERTLKALTRPRTGGVLVLVLFIILSLPAAAGKHSVVPLSKLADPGAPTLGPSSAKAVIVEFSDFQCPYCSLMAKTIEELTAKYPDQLRVVFMDRPLVEKMDDGISFHAYSELAHEAGAEAQVQGKFWEMEKWIFQRQEALFTRTRPGSEADLAGQLAELQAQLVKAGEELGLDATQMQAALDDHRHQKTIAQRLQKAQDLEINGTPTVFVNGRRIETGPEDVKKAVEKAVKKK